MDLFFFHSILIGATPRVRRRMTAGRETRHAHRGIVTEIVELGNRKDEAGNEAKPLLRMRRRGTQDQRNRPTADCANDAGLNSAQGWVGACNGNLRKSVVALPDP